MVLPLRQAIAAACTIAVLCAFTPLQAAQYVVVPGALFRGVLTGNDEPALPVSRFAMRVRPVTNAEFLAFVQRQPRWQRGAVPAIFADADYLRVWVGPTELGNEVAPDAPVTRVSWFAAQAFCEDENARLPTWLEWEYVAAADATRTDARSDPAWRARILDWYASTADASKQRVGGEPNAYGVSDMHGLIWEWVDDFNALLVDADSRVQGDAEKLRFCGAGAITMKDRESYAILMRIALLSSMNAAGSTGNLGFRCARPISKAAP